MEDNPYRPSPSTLNAGDAPPSPTMAEQHAVPTPRWFILALAVLGIGGGALGLAIVAWLAVSSPPSVAHFIFVAALAAYAFGIHCGIAALRQSPNYLSRNAWFYWLQVPVLSSPALVYTFAAGAQVVVGMAPQRLIWTVHLGSAFQLFVAGEAPLAAGINLVAVAILVLIGRMKARLE